MKVKKQLSASRTKELLQLLESRFEKNSHRHKNINWDTVVLKLKNNPEKLWSLNEMEITQGEPDVVNFDSKSGTLLFFDCSKESPKGRRSCCYDDAALNSRKEHKPANSALKLAEAMGISVLTVEQYALLQNLEAFDLKTSSWVLTPDSIRKLGGALFCDRRYDHVFTYHNGAESYYAARGFRGVLEV